MVSNAGKLQWKSQADWYTSQIWQTRSREHQSQSEQEARGLNHLAWAKNNFLKNQDGIQPKEKKEVGRKTTADERFQHLWKTEIRQKVTLKRVDDEALRERWNQYII